MSPFKTLKPNKYPGPEHNPPCVPKLSSSVTYMVNKLSPIGLLPDE